MTLQQQSDRGFLTIAEMGLNDPRFEFLTLEQRDFVAEVLTNRFGTDIEAIQQWFDTHIATMMQSDFSVFMTQVIDSFNKEAAQKYSQPIESAA